MNLFKTQTLIVPDNLIDSIYKNQNISLEAFFSSSELEKIECPVNSCIIFRSEINEKKTAVGKCVSKGVFRKISKTQDLFINGVKPKDVNQASFIDSLISDSVLINVAIGPAGTGKTTLAMSYAAQTYLQDQRNIHLTKPTTFVGQGSNAFGPVPGDIEEKYAPYLDSYYIVLKKIFGSKNEHYFKQMVSKNHLNFTPIALARGCTYENCTFIIDEAQNLSWHELNSIVSRIGENSKCIILGDLNQIDTSMKIEETGLYQIMSTEVFKNSSITSAVELTTQYRSPITELIAKVHDELRERHTA